MKNEKTRIYFCDGKNCENPIICYHQYDGYDSKQAPCIRTPNIEHSITQQMGDDFPYPIIWKESGDYEYEKIDGYALIKDLQKNR